MKMTRSPYPFPPACCSRPTSSEYRILTVSEDFTFVTCIRGLRNSPPVNRATSGCPRVNQTGRAGQPARVTWVKAGKVVRKEERNQAQLQEQAGFIYIVQ